jgi:hypothetical protein
MAPRHTGEWRYSSTILDLDIRQRKVVSFLLRPHYSREGVLRMRWIGGGLGTRASLYGMDVRRTNLTSKNLIFVHWGKLFEYWDFALPIIALGMLDTLYTSLFLNHPLQNRLHLSE